MKLNRKEILKRAALGVTSLIVVLLLILGIKNSDFGKIAKYNKQDSKSGRDMKTRFISSSGMKVTVTNDIANLGDFTFNIAGDRKLIANISLKYKSKDGDESWFSNGDKSKKEILKKSVILRDAAINTMLGNSVATANSKKMRKALKDTLNEQLSDGEIEEVYFNQFIIQ